MGMDFDYCPRSVPGPGCINSWEEILAGCNCEGQCSAQKNCSCLMGDGDNYTFDGRILEKQNGAPILECHDECACSAHELSCQNRVLQKGVKVAMQLSNNNSYDQVFRCDDRKGYGVRAMENIMANSFICEYAGEVIGKEEVDRRAEIPHEHNYTLTIREHFTDEVFTTYIDPRLRGNIARFFNHSCDPNLCLAIIRVGRPVPCVGLFAVRGRNLEPGAVDDQPLSRSLIDLKSSSQVDKVTVKRRKQHKNKILEEAERAGIKKGRFEGISQFVRRVERMTCAFIEEHKLLTSKGLTGRNQADIDSDYALIEEKEKRQKDQKRRELANKIKASKELKEQAVKKSQEKLKSKEERRRQQIKGNLGFHEDYVGDFQVEETILRSREALDSRMDGINRQTDVEQTKEGNGKKIEKVKRKIKRLGQLEKNKQVTSSYQDEAILNQREVIPFGERYDAPPNFKGSMKKEMDQIMAKAGGKKLLLFSMLKTQAHGNAENLSMEGRKNKFNEMERQQICKYSFAKDLRPEAPSSLACVSPRAHCVAFWVVRSDSYELLLQGDFDVVLMFLLYAFAIYFTLGCWDVSSDICSSPTFCVGGDRIFRQSHDGTRSYMCCCRAINCNNLDRLSVIELTSRPVTVLTSTLSMESFIIMSTVISLSLVGIVGSTTVVYALKVQRGKIKVENLYVAMSDSDSNKNKLVSISPLICFSNLLDAVLRLRYLYKRCSGISALTPSQYLFHLNFRCQYYAHCTCIYISGRWFIEVSHRPLQHQFKQYTDKRLAEG
uniref:SET domain-containing protein n=1 Tax=Heterorhabditis bacteriophora TaxID=37862 RepID=A0A1I7X7L2_HETBA